MKIRLMKTAAGPVLNFMIGALSTLAGSYVASRLNEKQEGEARLERLEQIVDKLLLDEGESKKK